MSLKLEHKNHFDTLLSLTNIISDIANICERKRAFYKQTVKKPKSTRIRYSYPKLFNSIRPTYGHQRVGFHKMASDLKV